MSESQPSPLPDDLQFQRAEHLPNQAVDPNAPVCAVCKSPIASTYYHAQGVVVCPNCAERIQSGQQKPPATSLAKSIFYGLGAAIAGCILYAAVAILLHLELALVAIAIGFMVGKAVRAGSNGLGGRPQQILAVLLTYFSITTSYIPVVIHERMNAPKTEKQATQSTTPAETEEANSSATGAGIAGMVVLSILLFAAAPFFGLTTGVGGWISLFIIFIGLRQAWRLTGRSDILVMGPYERSAAQ